MKELKENWPAGVKRTKPRERILAILESSETPLSAADICSSMGNKGVSACLSTVYRVLELFRKKGMVIKINMMHNEMAVYELNRSKYKHYAVCINCRKIIAIDDCRMDRFMPQLEDEQFRVMGHTLEVYGFCKDCSPT